MESLIITATQKENIYQEIIPQIKAITEGERDLIANMANISAVIKEAFNFWWVGFYLVKPTGDRMIPKENIPESNSMDAELVLGPFQGPLACTRIKYNHGVCGTTWKERKTIIVPDVEQFPGHIACSSLSRSEIVVPMFGLHGEVIAVLDIDSKDLETFDHIDAKYLEQITSILQ